MNGFPKRATAIIQTRVPAARLRRAERILGKLGLTPDQAVNMMLAQIEIRKALPFEVSASGQGWVSAEEQGAIWREALGAY